MLKGYSPIRPLGNGATGVVFLAGRAPPDDSVAVAGADGHVPDLVAVKAFRTSRDHDNHLCKNEEIVLRKIAAAPTHPFLPKFYSAVDEGDFRFLYSTYCPGGDLNSLRRSQPDRKFSISAIRFYAAEIVLALEHLHSLGVVYRDLKPGNILISEEGHIMLSDFDLSAILPPKTPSPSHSHAKASENPNTENHSCEDDDSEDESILQRPNWLCFVRPKKRKSPPGANTTRVVPASSSSDEGDVASGRSDKSHSFVGTEDYMAPEVVAGNGHDFAVDWWSLGVLLFEFAYGKSPFRGRHGDTYHNILHCEPRFPRTRKFHRNDDLELRDLIARLLSKDPARRLGACCGAVELKGHAFFAGMSACFTADGMRSRQAPKLGADLGTTVATQAGGRTFDLTAHLIAIECSRSEARAKKKIRAHMTAPQQRMPFLA